MSKAINVQTGHYKVAGRERQGEDVLQEQQRAAYTRQRKSMRVEAAQKHAGIPVWESTPPNLDVDRPRTARGQRGKKRTEKKRAAKKNANAAKSAATKRGKAKSGKTKLSKSRR